MKAEYTIRFYPSGVTDPITRTFKPRYIVPTNRARATVSNIGIENYIGNPEVLDKAMETLLVGDIDGLAWADAHSEDTDKVILDFFTMLNTKKD